MSKRLSLEEIIERLNIINPNIEVLCEFKKEVGKTKKRIVRFIKCRCKIDNYEWDAELSKLLNDRRGCLKCNSNRKAKTILEDAKNEFIKNGYIPLFDEYINSTSKLVAKTKEGYNIFTNLTELKSGYSPRIFAIENPFTIKNIKLWLKINNIPYELLSEQYVKSNKKLKMKCHTHGEFEITWGNLQSGKKCSKCAKVYKPTLEEVKNEFIIRGYNPLFDDYINGKSSLLAETSEGYKIIVLLDRLKRDNKPSVFGKGNPYTIENIKLWLKLNNSPYILLSDNYEKNNKKLKMYCKIHGDFDITWGDLQSGGGCKRCGIEKISNAQKIPIEQVRMEFAKRGYCLLSEKYINVETRLLAETKEGYKVTISLSNLKRGYTPCIFGNGNLYTIENIKLWLKLNDSSYDLISEEYEACDKKLILKCPQHGEFQIVWDNLKQGKGCPECSQSKGEQKIAKWFRDNNIDFIPQKEFDGLLGLGGKNLSYDFYLPQYNLLIEYQGEQHEKPINFNGDNIKISKKKFKTQLIHDDRKRNYAKINNIKLLEIWYYDFNNIEYILEEMIYCS